MNPTAIAHAADLLGELRNQGRTLPELPAGLRPSTRQDGYAIARAAVARGAVGPTLGWKIAATSTAGQRHINVDGPLAGRLLARGALADGGPVSLTGNGMRVAEFEIAFTMGRTLARAPGAAPFDAATVAAAVAALRPAIEVPNARYDPFTAVGAAQLIADQACAHQVLIGPAVPMQPDAASGTDPRLFGLADHAVQATRNGVERHDGTGRNVLGDPLHALVWLANELADHGLALAEGETAITGTCIVPVPVVPGDRVEGDWGWLGKLGLRFVD